MGSHFTFFFQTEKENPLSHGLAYLDNIFGHISWLKPCSQYYICCSRMGSSCSIRDGSLGVHYSSNTEERLSPIWSQGCPNFFQFLCRQKQTCAKLLKVTRNQYNLKTEMWIYHPKFGDVDKHQRLRLCQR